MEGIEAVDISQILSWKKQYDNIYYLKTRSSIYIFRALSRGEYDILLKSSEIIQRDIGDLLLEWCLLYPGFDEKIFDDKLAGEVDILTGHIMRKSGFAEIDLFFEDIKKHRESLNNLENQIIILICKAFPHLTPSDISNLTYEQILRYLVISESILDVKLDIEKQEPQKTGTINFEKENKVMGATPHNVPLKTPNRPPQKPKRKN